MRLLLLLPNIIFIIISGYNLWSEFNTETPDYLTYKVLHATVFISCSVFSFLIIKSIYKSMSYRNERDEILAENILA